MIRTRRGGGPTGNWVHVHAPVKKKPKPQPEPVPGVSVRCQCGRVVRIRKSTGGPVAHGYCRYAPATY